jgi:moderate conductance mechanosensitive channel
MRGRVRQIGPGVRGLLVTGLLALAGLASAQGSPEGGAAAPKLPEPLTREAIRELVARLSDAEVRQLLIAQLDRAAAPPRPAGDDMMGMVQGMAGQSQRVRDRAAELLRGAAAMPGALGTARARFLEGRGPGHLLLVVVVFLVMLGAGLLAERLYERAVRDLRRTLDAYPAEGLGPQVGHFVLRLLLDLAGLLVFVGGTLVLFFALYQGHEPTRQLVLTYLAAVVLVRVVALVARLLLAPEAPARRLVPVGDMAARGLQRGVVTLAAVYGFGGGTLHLFRSLGAPAATVDSLTVLVALLFFAVAVDTTWRVRADVAALIRGTGAPGPFRRLLAELWPVLATVYFAGILLARIMEILARGPALSRAPILSVVLLVALPLVDMALCRVLGALLSGRAPAGGGAPAAAGATFEPVLRKAVHAVVTVVGLLILADLWSVDLFTLAERGLGGRISGALLGVAVTLLLAWVLWDVGRTVIDRRLAAETGPVAAEAGEEGGEPASRLRTLLPLFRALLLAAIVVMATLSVLAALGINITPLLAGAGVIGLAIGFGSQTLVRDVVSGAFFLMDDAFRLGEYIEAGDSKGVVEKITVRSLHLRHHRGAVNVLPYGEISRLKNMSRDWMIMTLEFRLTYDTDLVKVKKILKRIGEELSADPELGPEMLQPLKSQGVMATEDSALLVRAKFMARPGSAPYLIRREAYTRILKAFAAEGIRFAHRQVTVFVPGATPTESAPSGVPPAIVAGGAAAAPDGDRESGSPA